MPKLMLLLLCLSPQLIAQEPTATATLPLADILKLYEENRTQPPTPQPAPLAGTLNSIRFTGRPRTGALELKGQFHLTLLQDEGWVRLPLLQKSPALKLADLPKINKGVIAMDGDQLVFMSRHSGNYQFEIKFLLEATPKGDLYRAQVVIPAATAAHMSLEADNSFFQFTGKHIIHQDRRALLYPTDNRFDISWKQNRELPKSTPQRAVIEATVPMAYGSIVSTREGVRIARYHYQLSLEGENSMDIQLPPNAELRRVYVNNQARAVTPTDTLNLKVTPKQAGDTTGSLELVLIFPREEYDLSGALVFTPPKISWPVNEFWLNLHLPGLFNYSLSGGSLSPAKNFAEPEYIYNVPTPGKSMQFHQYLIDKSAASMVLDYTIDLTDQYYQ